MTIFTNKEEYLKFIDEIECDIRVNTKKEVFDKRGMIAKFQPVKQIREMQRILDASCGSGEKGGVK